MLAFTITLVVLLPSLIRRVLRLERVSDVGDFAVRSQGTLITACIFVLGFSLVQAQSSVHHVEGLVTTEASRIKQVDRLLTRFGDPKLETVRAALFGYTKSIVADEFPLLPQGRGSEKTRVAFGPVSRGILANDPPPGRQASIYSDLL